MAGAVPGPTRTPSSTFHPFLCGQLLAACQGLWTTDSDRRAQGLEKSTAAALLQRSRGDFHLDLPAQYGTVLDYLTRYKNKKDLNPGFSETRHYRKNQARCGPMSSALGFQTCGATLPTIVIMCQNWDSFQCPPGG